MAKKDASAAAAKPKRANPFKQIPTVYKAVKTVDPRIGWWMLGIALATLAVFVLIGFALGHPIYLAIMGVPFAALAATITMSRRGERGAFKRMEGQPGGTAGALSTLRRGWYYDQEPVAADAARPTDLANAAMVFRALGRPGVVLLAEGPTARAKKLIATETKKINRVAPGVPVHTILVGSGEGETPIRKVSRTMTRLKPVLTKEEMSAVNKRLKSIPGIRQGLPPGIDPTKARMDRRALRGR